MISNISVNQADASRCSFTREMYNLVKEEDPEKFSKGAQEFLKKNGYYIDGLYRQTGDPYHVHVWPFLTRILKDCQEGDYCINGFSQGRYNRPIPQFKRRSEAEKANAFSATLLDRRPVGIRSKEEADYLAAKISEIDFPWDSTSGCEAKAEMVRRVLLHMNVPEKSIKKVWIDGGEEGLKVKNQQGMSVDWHWHIATMVETNNKKNRVIDPFFCKTKSLSYPAWEGKIKKEDQEVRLEKWAGKYTYSQSSGPIKVTEEMHNSYRQSMVAHKYSCCVPEKSLIQSLILEKLSVVDLTSSASLSLASSALPSPRTEKESGVCRIS